MPNLAIIFWFWIRKSLIFLLNNNFCKKLIYHIILKHQNSTYKYFSRSKDNYHMIWSNDLLFISFFKLINMLFILLIFILTKKIHQYTLVVKILDVFHYTWIIL